MDGWDEKQDCVSVMTLHAAKGLEFPVVYMLAIEQGILPHERSLAKNEEIEEERRLAFVGMTRAKEELYIYACPHARVPRPDALRRAEHVPGRVADRRRRQRRSFRHRRRQITRASMPLRETNRAEGWYDAGFARSPKPTSVTPGAAALLAASDTTANYGVGMIVDHATHGRGRVTEVSGHGALRKVKVRFADGERPSSPPKRR